LDEANFSEAKASRLFAKDVSATNAIGDKAFLQLFAAQA
jgi:hypothetical protein